MNRRTDIDGLRAVAVLPVLFYHAGQGSFGGGYVGVDVFFVISGYLITKILAKEIAEGRLSILNFYERRIRRIFPCLFAVILASSAAATVLLVPLDFHEYTKSAIAAVFFASNVLFFRQPGYFDDESAAKPLLHTWSLAVEEQFYIFFPIMLWVLHRHARNHLYAVLAFATAASFALNVWAVRDMPGFTFYMAPTRMWELFVGALLALGNVRTNLSRIKRESLAWLGFALIAYAVLAFTSSTPFPGVNAVFPVLGASLLIQFGQNTSAGWLLSRKPLVFVGIISYSLYLWHWPIIVFSEYYLMDTLTGGRMVAVIAVSLLVATLSWRYIECPFRRQGTISRRSIFKAAATAMGSVALLETAGLMSNGWASRFPEEVSRLESYVGTHNPRRDQCHREEDNVIAIEKSCVYGAATLPGFAIWGDSHAGELVHGLGKIAKRHNDSVMQFSYSGCPPSLGMQIANRPNCRSYNDKVMRFLSRNSGISTIFLIARYESYQQQAEQFAAGIREAVATLSGAGKRVVLVYPIPTTSVSIPRALARHAARGADLERFSIDKTAYLRQNSFAFELLESLTGPNVLRVFPHEQLCRDDTCAVHANGTPLYYDHHHLNIVGSQYLTPLFEPVF
jgi:peptidoglycan/LPS O-acetylase OafA/YrhL